MKRSKLDLTATLLIILGIFVIGFAIAFTQLDPYKTVAQINMILN